MSTHSTRLVTSIVVACSVVVVTASGAVADDRLALSHDGVTWRSSLGAPLFDPAIRWVPGDSRTATFFVRNASPEAGNLAVDLLGAATGGLRDTGDLQISVRVDGGTWGSAATEGQRRLVTGYGLGASAATRVDLRIVLDAASTNTTQLRGSDVRIRAVLTDALASPGDQGGDDDGGPGALPDAGSPAAPWMVPLAGVLVIAGLLLVARARREEGHHG